MATFMEKEAALELLNGIIGTISRVSSSVEEFSKNKDLDIINRLIDEVSNIDYPDLDYQAIKKRIDEIEAPYNRIEETKIEIENRT